MSNSLAFQSTKFDAIDQNGQPWLQARQIGVALGYTRSDAILNLYERNKDEFCPAMTRTIEMMVGGQPTLVRIFSLRGCHLLAMFARTDVAKAFRKWVLDVLETLNRSQPQPALPTSTLTPDQQCTLKNMVDALAAKGMKHAALWSRFNNHFRIAKYSQLPQERMGEAIQYLMGLKLEPEQKALPPVQSSPDAALNELFRELNSHVDATYDVERRIYELLREVQAPALNVFGSFKKNLAIRSHETNESLWYAHGRTMKALQSNCRLMVLAARG